METLGARFFSKEITCTRIDNPDKERQTLAQLALIVRLVQEAFKAFAENQLQKFDALVGETSCQLRAIKVQGLAYDPNTVKKLRDSNVGANLEALIEKAKELFDRGCAHLFKEPPMHAQFCKKVVREGINNYKLPLDYGSCFLILSHTLYLTRDADKSQKTNPFQLSVLLPDQMKEVLPTEFYKTMVLCAKRCLAHDSVDSVIALAKEHGKLRELVLKKSVKDSCNLECAPCFPSIDVILEEVRQKGRPLALVIKRGGEKMLISFAAIEGRHVLVENDALGKEPVLIFEGVSTHTGDFVRDLLGQDPFARICELIRMNAAAHPQYAGSHKESSVTFLEIGKKFGDKIKGEVDPLSHTVEDVAQIMEAHCDRHEIKGAQRQCAPVSLEEVVLEYLRLEVLKGLASERGCTRENPTVFALQHIYCSTVGDVLDKHQVILTEEEE